ncbi:MAG: single-stranded DNA-binding protein [Lachnospiraceae bacterium]|nr:single-stranded DNA-binding protein [Lachnospiraceae bacterium]
MNKVILMGRLTREPDVRYSAGENATAVARYTLAVDRRFARRDGGNEQTADFIGCVAFGRQAEFAEKYLHQGTKIAITGRIQTGSYTNREGQRVYTTDVVVEEQEFAESKNASADNGNYGGGNFGGGNYGGGSYQRQSSPAPAPAPSASPDGFMNIPDGIDEELPFN